MKVLIVEDEALVALYLESLVVGFGHQVCAVAACAGESIEATATHAPDVALMDVRLARGTNGVDAAREIYSRHGVRCIFLSGNLDYATRHALAACHPIDFINKPVLPVTLRRALQTAERLASSR
jgi:DNA-binding NarL/FixJ family response regulator